ncbi:hypothetical protein AQI88_08320 [Streptomyces cellostaticus]|uniref:Nucleotide pyrophosphatase n=1 Tax=Streptomyces cellostaticus TaxID=67285 RepID=A0A101NPX5_9ACTN|nr:alkaline phosphatase family protein [Streptomyces cellostaticus]KUM97270.1 hypothetical protein AQI88_08320 [Streptomyces cellostaticus]GHI03936.1 hypothetical protein Scel_22570 [Streptomyces cellostaticus]
MNPDSPRAAVVIAPGLDHHLLRGWIRAGHLPHLAGIMERGSLRPASADEPTDPSTAWRPILGGGPGTGPSLLARLAEEPRDVLTVFVPEHEEVPGVRSVMSPPVPHDCTPMGPYSVVLAEGAALPGQPVTGQGHAVRLRDGVAEPYPGIRVQAFAPDREGRMRLRVADHATALPARQWSPWIAVPGAGGTEVTRLVVLDTSPAVIYATPPQTGTAAPHGPVPLSGLPGTLAAHSDGVLDDGLVAALFDDCAAQANEQIISAAAERTAVLVAGVPYLDAVQHHLWHQLDFTSHWFDSRRRPALAVLDAYRKLDELVGALSATCPELLIASPHGSQSLRATVDLNVWLRSRGLDGQAHSPDGRSLRLRLAGRDPDGVVPQSAAQAVLETIAARLGDLAEIDGSGLVVSRITTRPGDPARRPPDEPDAVVRFTPGHRARRDTDRPAGPDAVLVRSLLRVSGHHSDLDPVFVPGAVLTTRPAVEGRIDWARVCDLASWLFTPAGAMPPQRT